LSAARLAFVAPAIAIGVACAIEGCAAVLGVESLTGADAGAEASVDAAPQSDAAAGETSQDGCALSWTTSSGGLVPQGAVPNHAANDASVTLYPCRAPSDGGVIPGKLLPAWGCYVADTSTFRGSDYEVLVASSCALAWLPSNNGIAPAGAIVCGSDGMGPLYCCRAGDSATNPNELGHMGFSTNHACAYEYGGQTVTTGDFYVLSQQ
jgi:hypothetical protein